MAIFADSEVDQADPRLMTRSQCGKCGLYKTCNSPKMEPTGQGRKGVLIVAEAPGQTEDEEGIQLIGKAGQELRTHLKSLGCDLDRDCWKTNCVICRPVFNEIKDEYIEYCRPNLNKTIDTLNPSVVILLGSASVKSLIGAEWDRSVGTIGRWVGWRIPLQSRNVWICPSWHPSYLLRSKSEVLTGWFRQHLKAALELDSKPWDKVPNWQNDIKVEKSPSLAAKLIRVASKQSGDDPISFDYETDRLKPDHPDSSIVSCAICWGGKRTLAFPWSGEAVQATSELLQSPVPKIGANIKFEQRWTKSILGHGVRNWMWDCMIASHVLDCREDITSVKFQAFVKLGLPLWSTRVEQFLYAKSGNQKNRIREANLDDLLLYNGMDALVEYKLAQVQMREMNYGDFE